MVNVPPCLSARYPVYLFIFAIVFLFFVCFGVSGGGTFLPNSAKSCDFWLVFGFSAYSCLLIGFCLIGWLPSVMSYLIIIIPCGKRRRVCWLRRVFRERCVYIYTYYRENSKFDIILSKIKPIF